MRPNQFSAVHAANIPFQIPESLASYVIQFRENPDKTIGRLQKHLNKRGADAVGYFLLGWFFLHNDQPEQALKCANKARVFAPGSLFFQKLPYFFAHPHLFEAWCTPLHLGNGQPSTPTGFTNKRSLAQLNALIEKLAALESPRVHINEDTNSPDKNKPARDFSEATVTETLANIHEQQGKLTDALQAYKRLKQEKPDKADHFQEQIERLQLKVEQEKG